MKITHSDEKIVVDIEVYGDVDLCVRGCIADAQSGEMLAIWTGSEAPEYVSEDPIPGIEQFLKKLYWAEDALVYVDTKSYPF